MKKNTDLLIKFHTSVFFSSTVCLISSRPEQLAFHFSEWYVSSFAYVASAQFGTTTLKHLLSGLPRNFLSQHKLFSSLNRYHWGYKPAHSQPTQKHCAIWERNKVMCKYFIGCSETGFSFRICLLPISWGPVQVGCQKNEKKERRKGERMEDGRNQKDKDSPSWASPLKKTRCHSPKQFPFAHNVCDSEYIEPEAAVFNTFPWGKRSH